MDLLCIQMLLCLNGAKYTSLLMLIMLEQESFGLKHCAQTRKNQKYPLKKKGRVSILWHVMIHPWPGGIWSKLSGVQTVRSIFQVVHSSWAWNQRNHGDENNFLNYNSFFFLFPFNLDLQYCTQHLKKCIYTFYSQLATLYTCIYSTY